MNSGLWRGRPLVGLPVVPGACGLSRHDDLGACLAPLSSAATLRRRSDYSAKFRTALRPLEMMQFGTPQNIFGIPRSCPFLRARSCSGLQRSGLEDARQRFRSCELLHAKCMYCRHNGGMAVTITIRNVPTEVRDELAARAAGSGRSLQEYLRQQLIDAAEHPDPDALLQQARDRVRLTGSRLEPEAILAHRDADRR